MKKYLKLIRVKQWYKNILVFIALFFSFNIFNLNLELLTISGFISLCLISSAGYILNDIIDLNLDKKHPEKCKRPLPSGKISIIQAYFLSFILYILGFFIAYNINFKFLSITLLLSILTLIYSIYLKHIVIADILLISTNFILRALSGVFIIKVRLSQWFLLAILFLAFYLVSAKRYGDILLMGKKAKEYKPVLNDYSKDFVKTLINISLTGLILIYGLYIYSINKLELFYLYPIYMYILLRYLYLIYQGNPFIRNPENFILKQRDWPLIISSGIFGVLFSLIYYYF